MIEAYLRANKMFVDYNEVNFILKRVKLLWTALDLLMFWIQPQKESVYSSYLELDLADVEPCISGPKRYIML